jgi:hypothetical protein
MPGSNCRIYIIVVALLLGVAFTVLGIGSNRQNLMKRPVPLLYEKYYDPTLGISYEAPVGWRVDASQATDQLLILIPPDWEKYTSSKPFSGNIVYIFGQEVLLQADKHGESEGAYFEEFQKYIYDRPAIPENRTFRILRELQIGNGRGNHMAFVDDLRRFNFVAVSMGDCGGMELEACSRLFRHIVTSIEFSK